MKIEAIEIFLVFVIVVLQLASFIQTVNKIISFSNSVLSSSFFKLLKLNVPVQDLQRLDLDGLRRNIKSYNHAIPEVDVDGNEVFISKEGTVEINLISYGQQSNKSFNQLIKNINSYLLRNHNSSPDFNLIKDMVERHTDTIEEEINSSVSVPLYLGLMGTMLGIVIGLFSMSDLAGLEGFSDDNLTSGISILLGGVKIAMIGSFVGLLLTIINSAWFFKRGKILVDKRKNDFYSFIQIELLPTLTKDFSSVVDLMQRNLMKFNSDFNSNLQGLKQVFDSSYKTMVLQKSLIDSIDKAKVSEMTQYNVKVLKELNIAMNEFEKFNECFSSINRTIESSYSLTNKLDSILIRTGNFEKIAENLDDKLTKSDELIRFLSEHFADLENHKNMVRNSVADVSHGISDVFKDLKDVIKSSGQEVKDFTVEEVNILNKLISESHNGLKNLTYLESLNKEVIAIKSNSVAQNDKIKIQLDSLNSNLNRALKELKDLSVFAVTPKKKSIRERFGNILGSNKTRNNHEG
jgi:hypothetical protein